MRVADQAGEQLAERVDELLRRRARASHDFFSGHADSLARACQAMAERFAGGGRLIALAASAQGRSDAHHVAVEFVHPVIVGKRALPALAVTGDPASLSSQVELVLEPDDIVLAFDSAGDIAAAVALAGDRGCLTVGFGDCPTDWMFAVRSGDPFVDQEVTETAYHVLWELVHVFFEHQGLLAGAPGLHDTGPGASAFLYPFLAQGQGEPRFDRVLADVRDSILAKAHDIAELRQQTLTEGRSTLARAAAALRQRFAAGGRLLTIGNGASGTDAADAAADFSAAPQGWPPRPALALLDPAILTAIANDIGADAMFSRQVIAYAKPTDALLVLSTSGDSADLVAALAEARRRGLHTIALVGYDGGTIAAQQLADHVVVSRSQHIPRIQEAQATAYHALRQLVER